MGCRNYRIALFLQQPLGKPPTDGVIFGEENGDPSTAFAQRVASDQGTGGGLSGILARTVVMASNKSDCRIGLVKYAEIPSSRQRAASPRRPSEVSIMIVAPARLGSFLIFWANVNPSISGMRASRRTNG